MTQTVERMLPLYEAKMIHQYDHRWATYEPDGTVRDVTLAEKQDPEFAVLPRYWIREEVVTERLAGRWDQDWLLGWRDICRSTDERTMIASTFPTTAVGHTMPIALPRELARLLQANWSSFVFDYVARQKVGGTHMTYGYLDQLATLSPSLNVDWLPDGMSWVVAKADYLQSADSWCGAQRAFIRAELDAAFFHLYGLTRDEVDYIMDTFPIVQRKDFAEFGEYRTKRLILEIYDAMQHAIDTGVPYTSSADLGVSG